MTMMPLNTKKQTQINMPCFYHDQRQNNLRWQLLASLGATIFSWRTAHSKADVFAGAEGEVAPAEPDHGAAEAEQPADQGCCILL